MTCAALSFGYFQSHRCDLSHFTSPISESFSVPKYFFDYLLNFFGHARQKVHKCLYKRVNMFEFPCLCAAVVLCHHLGGPHGWFDGNPPVP